MTVSAIIIIRIIIIIKIWFLVWTINAIIIIMCIIISGSCGR